MSNPMTVPAEAWLPGTESMFTEAALATFSGSQTLPQGSERSFFVRTTIENGRRVQRLMADGREEPLATVSMRSANARPGPGRETFKVGPVANGSRQYVAVVTAGDGTDESMGLQFIDTENGKPVGGVSDRTALAMVFTGPDEVVYEATEFGAGGTQVNRLFRHTIGTDVHTELDLGDDYDPRVVHELSVSPDGTKLVVAANTRPWGVPNQAVLVDLGSDERTPVGDPKKMSEVTFANNDSLFIREPADNGYRRVDRLDLESMQRTTVIHEQLGAEIIDFASVTVDGREHFAVHVLDSGLLPRVHIVDPALEGPAQVVQTIELPGPKVLDEAGAEAGVLGTVDSMGSGPNGALVFNYTAFGANSAQYSVDLAAGEVAPKLVHQAEAPESPLVMPTITARLTSAQQLGRRVPYLVVESEQLQGGPAATLVEEFGGFTNSLNFSGPQSPVRAMGTLMVASGGRFVMTALPGTDGNGQRYVDLGHRENYRVNESAALAVRRDLVNKGLAEAGQIATVTVGGGALAGASLAMSEPGSAATSFWLDPDLNPASAETVDSPWRQAPYGGTAVMSERDPVLKLERRNAAGKKTELNVVIFSSENQNRTGGRKEFVRAAQAGAKSRLVTGSVVSHATTGPYMSGFTPKDVAAMYAHMAEATGHEGVLHVGKPGQVRLARADLAMDALTAAVLGHGNNGHQTRSTLATDRPAHVQQQPRRGPENGLQLPDGPGK